jgi:L-2-hydroxyglutarate oxidase LhgO
MNSDYVLDTLVIGAGVVGLAVARALAANGHETMLVERHRRIGEETSSRNSGVIHSGIYYPTGSLKARLCVRGKTLLYDYCRQRAIPHLRCGKIIVAGAERATALQSLYRKGIENGVDDLRLLDAGEVRNMEPEVRCAAGLHSPSTGIVDVHELMNALLGDFEAAGGTLVLGSAVEQIRLLPKGIEVVVNSGGDVDSFIARRVVNSAGLSAVALARQAIGFPGEYIPEAYLAKGNYFSCTGRPFRHLVYPMPNEAGLGIHATLDLAGNVNFGPDVEWVDSIDYEVDPGRAERFYSAIREYWPELSDGRLQPAYSGIRAKIVGPGEQAADFRLEGPAQHGVRGLVHLFGIESPGLTAALAIGEHVSNMLTDTTIGAGQRC